MKKNQNNRKKMSLANINGKLTLSEMENIMAGSNRTCFIDGALTFLVIGFGGGILGGIGGLYAMNANGCFN